MVTDYNINKEIGKGGMGCVYLATNKSTGKKIALKMMSNQMTCYPEYRDLFASEVQTLKLMNHPSVVRIEGDCFSDQAGNLYLPMEFVEGKTVEKEVKEKTPYPPKVAVGMMIKILEAIEYIHKQGKIHRDIKPSNIMVRPDGSICVIDFGIAKDIKIGSSGKTIGVIIGTDGYMSPEQANGYNIDHRTDIYSLGCLFFYMLTGTDAVKKATNNYETRLNILNTVMTPPSAFVDVPEVLDKVYLKSVDKNMTNRYQDARSFREALENVYATGDRYVVKVGKLPDNDIVVPSQYVSRHHLTIEGIMLKSGRQSQRVLKVTDHSRNGIGMEGRKYNNESLADINFDGNPSLLPEILLSGLPDLALDWQQVISMLEQRGWCPEVPPPPESPVSAGLKIACFLFPIVGWILWGVWKSNHPQKALSTSKWAWIGFGVQFALLFLTLII